MRQIGSISSVADAERFADFLRAEGVGCSVDTGDSGFRIWVQDDDLVAGAKEKFSQFVAEPNHERYRDASRRAKARLQEDQRRRNADRVVTVNVADRWNNPWSNGFPITYGLIAISLVVAVLTSLDPKFNDQFASKLFFSIDGTFRSIRNGEPWRLVSPIFLHFGLMHFVFNMLMTYQFGMEIEYRRGSAKLLGMVLVIAALSNASQFWFHGASFHGRWFGDPHFGGMSGVVYGLFGYIWVKGRLDPRSGFNLPQQTVTMMLIWHVLCVIGVIPNVANWCHGIGLVTGIAIAMIGSLIKPLLRRP